MALEHRLDVNNELLRSLNDSIQGVVDGITRPWWRRVLGRR